ncbi:hypothetical protein K0B03_02855 [Patescibacteria group bacterium]|nr:hypothetical protein [Patescibacteria group bacterium]
MKNIPTKNILLIFLVTLFLASVFFVFLKDKNVSNDSEIVIVENIIYVGEEKLDYHALMVLGEQETSASEDIEVRGWFSDFIKKNIARLKPKEINVPEDYLSIQEAIENAKYGDIIKVAAGEYNENISMKQGVHLVGTEKLICRDGDIDFDFECTEEEIALGSFVLKQDEGAYDVDLQNQDNVDTENQELEKLSKEDKVIETDETAMVKVREKLLSSIINGEGFGNVVTFKNDNIGKNEISGFVIKNSGKSLSGIYVENSSPWIYDNIIIDNEFGIYVKGDSYPVIQKNILQFSSKGIQVYNFEKREEFIEEEIIIEKEEVVSEIAKKEVISEMKEDMLQSDAAEIKLIITDNLITDNKTGIDINRSSAFINHNTIAYNNHYKMYLGATYGINLSDSSAQIANNIITDSGICELCAGVNVDVKSTGVVLKYNNIWNNKNNYVCYGECELAENNLSEDPLFIDSIINGDYRLSQESGLLAKSEVGFDIGVRW